MMFQEEKYAVTINIRITWSDGLVHVDSIKGFNSGHALHRAWWNWPDAQSITII